MKLFKHFKKVIYYYKNTMTFVFKYEIWNDSNKIEENKIF